MNVVDEFSGSTKSRQMLFVLAYHGNVIRKAATKQFLHWTMVQVTPEIVARCSSKDLF